ncbi:hypothetical protein [Massilia sp. Mn16-1_5]|uniref:hypothetical protein n=1 Tax=Massilia sp. Mn16-1_5 TaxID=2079199 RepID=UPI00109EC998|nr:hypothetical protein [Massilia sp. Mn16-1_5]THC46555.1 hypothetical protein C2862_00170 [Massilia sp. Mn16-1_5]
MWIVAIGWSYVVILMAATETSFVAGVMTFLVYCMIPLSILFYLTGAKRRRARRAAEAAKVAPSAAEVIANLPPPPLAVAKNTQVNGIIGASGAAASMCDGGDGGCGQ